MLIWQILAFMHFRIHYIHEHKKLNIQKIITRQQNVLQNKQIHLWNQEKKIYKLIKLILNFIYHQKSLWSTYFL